MSAACTLAELQAEAADKPEEAICFISCMAVLGIRAEVLRNSVEQWHAMQAAAQKDRPRGAVFKIGPVLYYERGDMPIAERRYYAPV